MIKSIRMDRSEYFSNIIFHFLYQIKDEYEINIKDALEMFLKSDVLYGINIGLYTDSADSWFENLAFLLLCEYGYKYWEFYKDRHIKKDKTIVGDRILINL